MTNEEIYDLEIAPQLLSLCKRCQSLGMSFIASVEFDPTNAGRGRTEYMAPDELDKLSSAQRITHWASRCNGNIDQLFIACDRHGKQHGHSSVYLQLIGNKNVKYSGNEFASIAIAYEKK